MLSSHCSEGLVNALEGLLSCTVSVLLLCTKQSPHALAILQMWNTQQLAGSVQSMHHAKREGSLARVAPAAPDCANSGEARRQELNTCAWLAG